MKWQALLIHHNELPNIDHWLIQTDTKELYPIKVNSENESRKEIAKHIADIAQIDIARVRFMQEKRRRDKLVVYEYMVMHDIEPPF